jgi:hypothetical protein
MVEAAILFLGPADSRVLSYLSDAGEEVLATGDPVDAASVVGRFRFLVSHGYRHIVTPDVLELFPGRAVNLHISYLPWNRGAHPNVWSVVEGTPSGVTVHHMDEGIDTGDIIAQQELRFDDSETLQSSYDRLEAEVGALFAEHWELIRSGSAARRPQRGPGTYHRASELERIWPLLDNGWNTVLGTLRRRATRAAVTPVPRQAT